MANTTIRQFKALIKQVLRDCATMTTTKLLSPAKNCKPRYATIGSLNHQPAVNYIFNVTLAERQQILHTVLSLKTRVTTKVKQAI